MTKPIRAWAVINETLTFHENRPMIYKHRADAVFHKYAGYKVVKVLITFPQKKVAKKKMKK